MRYTAQKVSPQNRAFGASRRTGPAEELLHAEEEESIERGVLEEVIDLFKSGLGLLGGDLLLGRDTSLRARLGDKDLVAGHVTGRSVVLGVLRES
jgi:hypothetical protein